MQIAPTNSSGDYYGTPAFQEHRININNMIATLPHQTSPCGWSKGESYSIGGLEYIGFSDDSQYLLVVSSSGRGVIDISTGEKVARDRTPYGEWLNENQLSCQGIGPLSGKTVRITGLGGGGLPTHTPYGDSLYLAATLYPCYEVVYQPPFQSCFSEKNNRGCVIIFRGFIEYYGFSWDGEIMVVVNEDIHLWYRDKQ